MNETALMETPQRDRRASRDAQKRIQVPRLAEESRKDLGAVILDQEYRLSVVANEFQRPCSPGRIELIPESIRVLKPRDAGRWGLVQCRR